MNDNFLKHLLVYIDANLYIKTTIKKVSKSFKNFKIIIIILISKDALNWSEVTEVIQLQKIYSLNTFWFLHTYQVEQLFSELIIKQKCFLSSKSVY